MRFFKETKYCLHTGRLNFKVNVILNPYGKIKNSLGNYFQSVKIGLELKSMVLGSPSGENRGYMMPRGARPRGLWFNPEYNR